MPLMWSEAEDPNKDCSYTHVISDTPLGKLFIEWKGWKDHDSHLCHLPWGEMVIGNDLTDAKELVQAAWDRMAIKMQDLVSA